MKEVNAWVAGDEGDAGEEGTFAKVHKKVTGKDAGGLLPETDYAQPQAALGSIADEGMADDDNDQGDGSDESGDDAEEPDGTQIGDDDALDDEEGAYEEEKAASRSKVFSPLLLGSLPSLPSLHMQWLSLLQTTLLILASADCAVCLSL